MQTLQVGGRKSLSEYELRATAADVHHQAPLAHFGEAVGNAQVDESCLLVAGYHLDLVADCALGLGNEPPRIPGLAQRIRADDANRLGWQRPQALPEPGQTRKRAFTCLGGQPAGIVEAGGQANRLAQAVEHL